AMLVKRTEPKPSRAATVLAGAAGSVYPGYPPLRLDLEDLGSQRPLGGEALAALAARALAGLGAAVAALQEHRRDVVAPDRLPVAVRVHALIAGGRRLQIVDEEGNALHLPDDPALEARLGAALQGLRLRALFGDVGLDAALPTLYPRALLLE